MSAAAGVLHLDGRPGAARTLQPMLDAVRQPGPGDPRSWRADSVALGHCAYGAAGAGYEGLRLPQGAEAPEIGLTADVRLDNRGELLRLMDYADSDPLNDAALLLAAYLRWGKGFLARLVGDFSLAIWDGHRRVLLCARDQTGMRQLYYHHAAGRFCCSSALRGMLALPGLPRQLDERRLAEHLVSGHGGHERTFYRHVKRLPPAHLLEIGAAGVSVERYWAFDSERELQLGSDAEYREAFREVFMLAVSSRLRGAQPVGATLSGGLDSSSVACAAQQLSGRSLPTFSLVYPHLPACDETPFIQAVLRRGSFEPHLIATESLTPLSDWDNVMQGLQEPAWGPNAYLPWAVYRAVSRSGVRVLLTGSDGDSALSHGLLRLADLASAGSYGRLLAEAGWYCWRTGRSPWSVIRSHVLGPLAPPLVRNVWRRVRGRDASIVSQFDLLRPDFRRRVGLEDPWVPASGVGPQPRSRERARHFARLTDPLRDRAFEYTARLAGAFGVELRHPFEDRRLLELCLALPAEQKLRQGWSRSILRRAVGDLLPPEVRRRVGKTNYSHSFARGMRMEQGRLEQLMGRPLERLAPYADLKRLRQLHRQCMVSPGSVHGVVLFRVVSLLLWLQTAPNWPE